MEMREATKEEQQGVRYYLNSISHKVVPISREGFLYGLMACNCLLKDGKTWYEHNELIECFEDLGLIPEEDKEDT